MTLTPIYPIMLWFLLIFLAVWSQKIIIDKKKRFPVKWFWFSLRVMGAGLVAWRMISLGFNWAIVLIFLAGSSWLPFYTGLNLWRDKDLIYLSPKNSPFDRFMVKLFGGDPDRIRNEFAETVTFLLSYAVFWISSTLLVADWFLL